jgi:hypothetical protein
MNKRKLLFGDNLCLWRPRPNGLTFADSGPRARAWSSDKPALSGNNDLRLFSRLVGDYRRRQRCAKRNATRSYS